MASVLKQTFDKTTTLQPDMNAMFADFKKNPMSFLLRAKLDVPEAIKDNPQAMVTHLMQTGQIPRQLLPRVQQMFRR